MKQFLINTASNTLTAVALVGALAFAAAPAKADTRDVIGGLFVGLLLGELNKSQHTQPIQQHSYQTQNINNRVNPRRECDVQYRRGTGYNTWERISYNCLGQIIETRTVK